MVVISQLSEPSSTSSSSSTHHHRFDVFLGFRGVDTRLSFTDHLYKALLDANITTFLDDEEIETGEDLKPELESAIKASRASIIVLSKNYAYSTWCLDELVLILHQHRTSNHIVIPIFYHVEPTDVRKQQNSFGDAMAMHKQRMETETNKEKKSQLAQKMKLWKKALTEVADLKGEDAKGRHETKFIEEIVRDMYHRLGAPLRSTLPLFYGMEYSINVITSWLKDGSLHNADILTIYGLNGIGKTSLAKHVYELHRGLFDRSSFIEGVNDKCPKRFDILGLQKQLCDGISKTSHIQIPDVFKYTSMIENAVACQKVFIVLDDIGSPEQLDALLGKKGLHPGSKIIITTKDASLTEKYALTDSKVQPKHTKHFLEGLDQQASLQLLSHHAFKGGIFVEGYEVVSKKLIAYCRGHPLVLKVLGGSLFALDVTAWEECIERLVKGPNSDVREALLTSFEFIQSNDYKELFKHIACFYVGKDRNYTETILKACGIPALQGIQNLINRCLLTIGPNNELKMHQLLQEMGRDVVRQESPNELGERSRLWRHEDSFNVLQLNRGTGKLKGLVLDMEMLEEEKLCGSAELNTDALNKMENLMLLQLNYVQLNGFYKNFPKKLRWLCMRGSLLKSIPSDLGMENLVDLDMSYSNLESFNMSDSNLQPHGNREKYLTGSCSKKEKQKLGSLKFLNISFSNQLRSVGGFSKLPVLERLILTNCIGLTDVCESIEHCHQLVHIDLRNCYMIKKVPSMVKLKKIKTLLLDGCNLGESQIEMKDVDTISRDLTPFLFCLPSSLVSLSLKNCNLSNESFPVNFNHLSSLKSLCLDGNSIVSLPNCVRSLSKLEKLTMAKCDMLKTVMHPPNTLRELTVNSCEGLQKIVFDRKMSSHILGLGVATRHGHLPVEVEGLIKLEAMADVEEEVLHSLGWTNLEFIKNQPMEPWPGIDTSQVQMYYEYGIFSTFYWGREIPNWIRDRSKGSSILFTMPSSPNSLRGINFCHVQAWKGSRIQKFHHLPMIIISNITKNHTWIYKHFRKMVKADEEFLTVLSHWMFGKNEMGDGDQVTAMLAINNEEDDIRECGISLVYDDDDDGKMEGDPLAYYKSWNHIIGGDTSIFQTKTGEYLLHNLRLYPANTKIHRDFLPYVASGSRYKASRADWFRPFKADVLSSTTESAGVQFSQRPEVLPKNHSTSDISKRNSRNGELTTTGHDRSAPPTAPQTVPESRDEKTLISQAIQLNHQPQKALSRHDALVSNRSVLTVGQIEQEEAEEEDPEQLFRRMRKGKAFVRPKAENYQTERPLGLLGLLESSVPADRLNRPLIRPISLEAKQEPPSTTRPTAALSIPPPSCKTS